MSRRDFSAVQNQHQQVLRELHEERAAALARISRTLDALLTELRAIQDRLAVASPEERPRALTAYRETRQQAVKYRWYLEVQREAVGIRRHEHLDEFYRIPAPIDR